jgi:tetratricopeptide (TPR) repeat protein
MPRPDALDAGNRRRHRATKSRQSVLRRGAAQERAGVRRERRSAPPLPLSIRGAVLARAALLSDEQRRILSLAAVLGERFSVERLVALSSAPRDDVLLRAGARACAASRVRSAQRPGELHFRHALTQEVLYGELLAERVRPLHEAIGLELERRPDRNAASVELAHHWRRAGDLRRAAAYAELRGRSSLRDRRDGRRDLVLRARALSARKGGWCRDSRPRTQNRRFSRISRSPESGIRRLQRAGDLYWEAGDFDGFAKNASALGALIYNAGDTAAAIELYRRTIDALGPKLPAASVDLLRARMGYNCVAALDFDSALTLVCEIETNRSPTRRRRPIRTRRGSRSQQCAATSTAGESMQNVLSTRPGESPTTATACTRRIVRSLSTPWASVNSSTRASTFARPLLANGRALPGTVAGALQPRRSSTRCAAILRPQQVCSVGPNNASEQSYAILVHIKSAQFALGICAGDETRICAATMPPHFLHYGVEHGMKLASGLLGGPYAWALGLRGDVDEPRQRGSIASRRSCRDPTAFCSRFSRQPSTECRATSSRCAASSSDAASRPQDRVNKAALGLFDAFAAQRGLVGGDARKAALDAASAFETIGWPWLAARSYELGGESKRALETYRGC